MPKLAVRFGMTDAEFVAMAAPGGRMISAELCATGLVGVIVHAAELHGEQVDWPAGLAKIGLSADGVAAQGRPLQSNQPPAGPMPAIPNTEAGDLLAMVVAVESVVNDVRAEYDNLGTFQKQWYKRTLRHRTGMDVEGVCSSFGSHSMRPCVEERGSPMSAGRRGNGEGTILKRADGRWAAAIVVDYRRKWIYGKTRRGVADRLRKIQGDVAEGRPVINERLTMAEYLNRWLYEVAKQRTRPMTWRGYEQLVRVHILPSLGRVRLAKLTPQHVHSLVNQKVREGRLSPRTIQYMHSVLRAALNQAVRWRMVHYNAAAMVSPPRGVRREAMALTPEAARRLLNAARGDRLEALYSVALALGLRQGEALGLKWGDIDLETGLLRVRRASQRIPHQGTQLVETKTARSRRTLVMPPTVINALRAHRARQAMERLVAGERWIDLDLVFPSERGTLADGPNVTHRFHKLLKRAELPAMRFHDLRHACASLLLVQGVHRRVVMETLGHSQISLTMNTYSHVLPALQREAADRMEAALTGP